MAITWARPRRFAKTTCCPRSLGACVRRKTTAKALACCARRASRWASATWSALSPITNRWRRRRSGEFWMRQDELLFEVFGGNLIERAGGDPRGGKIQFFRFGQHLFVVQAELL